MRVRVGIDGRVAGVHHVRWRSSVVLPVNENDHVQIVGPIWAVGRVVFWCVVGTAGLSKNTFCFSGISVGVCRIYAGCLLSGGVGRRLGVGRRRRRRIRGNYSVCHVVGRVSDGGPADRIRWRFCRGSYRRDKRNRNGI